MIQNPYKVLGINDDASLSDIKAAYRVLVKKHHPDKGGDKKTILEINEAWEILKDKKNRDLYKNKKNDSEADISNIQTKKKNGQNKIYKLWGKLFF